MVKIAINILLVIHVFVSLFIVLLVLMQRPKNEGLGAAFGGGMTENLFGAQTTNVLQTITRWLGGIFFVLTLSLSWLYVKQTREGSQSAVQQKLSAPTVIPPPPAAPPAASTPLEATVAPSPNATPGTTIPVAPGSPENAPQSAPDNAPAQPNSAAPQPPAPGTTSETPKPAATTPGETKGEAAPAIPPALPEADKPKAPSTAP